MKTYKTFFPIPLYTALIILFLFEGILVGQDPQKTPGAENLEVALKYYAEGNIDSLSKYCDLARNEFLEEKNLQKYVYTHILVIQFSNTSGKYRNAQKWIKKSEANLWGEPSDKLEYGTFGSYYMQKGYAEYNLQDFEMAIESYETCIKYYQKTCDQTNEDKVMCLPSSTAFDYIVYPLNKARLNLALVEEVLINLNGPLTEKVKKSIPKGSSQDPLARLYGLKADAYIKKRDTATSHFYNTLRKNLTYLGREERMRADISYANTWHLEEDESKKADELLEEKISELQQNSSKELLVDALLFQSYIARDRGDLNRALNLARESLDNNLEVSEKPASLLKNYWLLGNLYYKKKNYENCRKYYKQAISCVVPAFDSLSNIKTFREDSIKANFNLEQLFRAIGDSYFEEGESYLKESKENKNAIPLLESALHAFKLMIKTEDQMKRKHLLQSSRLLIGKRRSKYVEAAIKSAYYLYKETQSIAYLDSALFFMEKSRAQEMDLVSNLRSFINGNDELEEKYQEVNQAMVLWQDKLFKTCIQNNTPPNLDIEIVDLYEKYISKLRSFQEDLAKQDLGKQEQENQNLAKQDLLEVAWNWGNDIGSISSLKKDLGSKKAILSFFETDSLIYILAISKNGQSFNRVLKDTSFNSKIDSIKYFLANPQNYFPYIDAYKKYAYDLYELIFTPLKFWDIQEVVCVISASFQDIPLEVLLTEESSDKSSLFRTLPYLWKRYNFRYQYSVSAELKEKVSQRVKSNKIAYRYIGFAPDYSDIEPLPSSTYEERRYLVGLKHNIPEIRNAARILSQTQTSKLFEKQEANRYNFRKYAESTNILHLSMHAAFPDPDSNKLDSITGKPRIPRLIFGKEDSLMLYDIYALNLNSSLTILGACQTGLGPEEKGEGIMSLGRAFIFAGSKSIVQSLWNVNDYSSGKFLPGFMEGLRDGQSKSEALKKARNYFLTGEEVEDIYTHPYYWAQFVVYGDNSSISQTAGKPTTIQRIIGWLILISLVLGGSFFIKNYLAKRQQI